MVRAPGLLVPLLGLVLALGLPKVPATDCGSLGPAARLTFTPVARARWLAPRVRPPGLLDHLYGTVRHFLSSVQLNPFPAGECKLPQESLGRDRSWPAPLSPSVWGAWRTGFSAFPTPIFLPPTHLPAREHHQEAPSRPSCAVLAGPLSEPQFFCPKMEIT